MAVARIARKRIGLDTETRMAAVADFGDGREPGTREHEPRKVDPIDELKRLVGEQGAGPTPRWPRPASPALQHIPDREVSLDGIAGHRPPLVAPSAPMPDAAAAFVDIMSKSSILRSQHDAYRNDRARRLAFCALLRDAFGIVDEGALAQAFRDVCVGDGDANGEHDVQQAMAWAANASPTGRGFSARKLLCDASVALRTRGEADTAVRAACLATVFLQLENSSA